MKIDLMQLQYLRKLGFHGLASKFLASLFFFTVFTACQEQKIDFSDSDRGNVLLSFSDDIFFGWIKDIKLYDDKILWVDAGQNKIHVTSNTLEYLGSFGSPGPGPFEFKGVLSMAIDPIDSLLAVYDFSSKKVVLFNKQFEAKGEIPKILNGFGQISLNHSSLFASSNMAENPHVEIDIEQKVSNSFGIQYDKFLQEPDLSYFVNKDAIFVLTVQNDLILRKYGRFDHEMIWERNLFENDFLIKWKESLNISKLLASSNENIRRAQILAMDAELIGDDLYILLPQIIINKKNYPNFLLKFNVHDKNSIIELIKVQESDEDNFSSFIVSDKTFYGYSPGSGAIYSRNLK